MRRITEINWTWRVATPTGYILIGPAPEPKAPKTKSEA